MDFSAAPASRTYSDRSADAGWLRWCEQHLAPAGRDIVDIACGGGIYARGFAALGAASVVGVDASAQYVEEACAAGPADTGIAFVQGSAAQSGLPDGCADVVFCRALIHHLGAHEMRAGAAEMRRLLRAGGICAVQDRTQEDVESNAAAFWIRSTLFEVFPRLFEFERARRPQRDHYAQVLQAAGFGSVRVMQYSERRRRYASLDELEAEVMARKGKSILFELSDAELGKYCARLRQRSEDRTLEEIDPWTIWIAAPASERSQ